MPGANATFIDALPGKPCLAIGNFFDYHDAGARVVLPFGELRVAGISATASTDTILAFYETPLQILGGDYTVGAAIPYLWLRAKGEAVITGSRGRSILHTMSDRAEGLGDIILYPFTLAGRDSAGS
jgi:hypothetical protein